jgi:integrase
LKALFEVVAGPLAQPHTPGVRFGGLRTVAFDGCGSVKIPDTPRNRTWIGRIRCRMSWAGYPTLRLMALAETGTRGLLGATVGSVTGRDETALATRLLPLLRPSMLVLLDRSFDAGWFFAEIARTGAMLLCRARDGSAREKRQLKHRAEGDSRVVPIHPELTKLLRDHLARFDIAHDGRLFGGVRGGELPTITYRRAWIKARQTAFTEAEQASPLARRPYDLRHACLSTRLNGGVYPTQLAEWAGHSVDVLLRIYAKCVVGQDELAKRRISEALLQD